MKPFLGVETTIRVGVETAVESDTADGTLGVVFEDDGNTGYFYARDYRVTETLFVDALHIYNVGEMTDLERSVQLKIIWTRDFAAAALLFDQQPQAVFHFGRRCGYAADPFPKPDAKSSWNHSAMDLSIRELFFHGS